MRAGFITEHYGQTELRTVHAIQVEINRGLYLNETYPATQPAASTRFQHDLTKINRALGNADPRHAGEAHRSGIAPVANSLPAASYGRYGQ